MSLPLMLPTCEQVADAILAFPLAYFMARLAPPRFTVDGLPLVASWGGANFTARATARVRRGPDEGWAWPMGNRLALSRMEADVHFRAVVVGLVAVVATLALAGGARAGSTAAPWGCQLAP